MFIHVWKFEPQVRWPCLFKVRPPSYLLCIGTILKYVLVGFPPVMGSLLNPSFQAIGLWPIMDFVTDGRF